MVDKTSRRKVLDGIVVSLEYRAFSDCWIVSVGDVFFKFGKTDSAYRTALRFFNKAEVMNVEGIKDID